MIVSDILSLLESSNPAASELSSLFVGFSKMSPNMLQLLFKTMDENVLRKIATWSQTFSQHMNDLGPDAFDPKILQEAMDSGTSDDFFDVMKQTKYVGPKLDFNILQTASNDITMSLKANNFEQGIYVGITLAKFIPV